LTFHILSYPAQPPASYLHPNLGSTMIRHMNMTRASWLPKIKIFSTAMISVNSSQAFLDCNQVSYVSLYGLQDKFSVNQANGAPLLLSPPPKPHTHPPPIPSSSKWPPTTTYVKTAVWKTSSTTSHKESKMRRFRTLASCQSSWTSLSHF